MTKKGDGKRKRAVTKYTAAEDAVLRNAAEEAAALGDNDQPESTSSAPSTSADLGSEHSSTAHPRYMLDPMGLWFDHAEVKADVVNAIHGYYLHPWKSYTHVNQETKDHWFDSFSHKYVWPAHLHNDVRRRFDSYATDRLRDMVYKVIQKGPAAERPKWMSEEVHKRVCDIPSKDEKYKAHSVQNKKKRRAGSMENPAEPTHFQGSISATQHARKLCAENDGKFPDAPDVFLRTHFKEVQGIGRVPVNRRAQATLEAYEQIQTQSSTSTEGSQRSVNDMFYEATGGRNNKGRVRGLGKGAELYYGASSRGRGSGSTSDYHPSVMARLKDQVRDEVRDELRVEFQAEMDRREQLMRQQMEDMMRSFGTMGTPTCSNFQPQRRDQTDDDEGGGNGAGLGIPSVI